MIFPAVAATSTVAFPETVFRLLAGGGTACNCRRKMVKAPCLRSSFNICRRFKNYVPLLQKQTDFLTMGPVKTTTKEPFFAFSIYLYTTLAGDASSLISITEIPGPWHYETIIKTIMHGSTIYVSSRCGVHNCLMHQGKCTSIAEKILRELPRSEVRHSGHKSLTKSFAAQHSRVTEAEKRNTKTSARTCS